MHKITSDAWQVQATSVAHKQHLLDYAALHGVPVAPIRAWRYDGDLFINWWGLPFGLGVLPTVVTDPKRPHQVVTPAQFEAMCDEYAVEHNVFITIPRAERHENHG